MARFIDPTREQVAAWRAWVAERPPAVREVAARLEPWTLYRQKGGHRVIVRSIDEHEDGTVTLKVLVSGLFNKVVFEREVFGVKPEELEPCELPGPREALGSELQPHEVTEDVINQLREFMNLGKRRF